MKKESIPCKNLIFNAFAYLENHKSGENINAVKEDKIIDLYMKMSISSLVSAKIYNPDCDVALITNCAIPIKYQNIFKKHNIMMIQIDFNEFVFDKNMKWNLAFFKLCALKYVINNLSYDNYLLLDTDTYVQKNLSNLFLEASQSVLLFNMQHSIDIKQAIQMNLEYQQLYQKDVYLTNYGGEFICGSNDLLKVFMNECDNVYKQMIDNQFQTKHGDEFIIGCAAHHLKSIIKDGAPYIYRYWTNSFYLVSTNYKYNPISILHLPDEKNYGLLWIANYIIKKEQLPPLKKVYRRLNMPKDKPPFYISIYFDKLLHRILKK